MIKVAKTDVWSHSTTLAPDLHGAACEVVSEFALCSIGNLHSNSFVPTFAPTRWMRLLLKSLGPGVITGAADDDPSGIATYSVAGAQLGMKLLWTALLTWPLMAAVQMMCARIGMVTGQGLAGNFKQRFPSWLLRVFIMALLAANTINIAADFAGMADAAEMLSGMNSRPFVVVFALLISWATVRLRYHQIANVLKWLVLVLFAYPITAFVVGADWGRVMRDTLLPSMPHSRDEWSTLVAILGTTISPYLFFWQASEEVEEEKAAGQSSLSQRRGATVKELGLRRMDVGVGTFFSNTILLFASLRQLSPSDSLRLTLWLKVPKVLNDSCVYRVLR
jgi:NRAMP (natural resistance-associated macrophage protein)-like metal ion transporter